MTKSVIKSVKTQPVGFAPILKHYFERCAIAKIIDENIELDPSRKVLTHGQASMAMITGILFQILQLYRICKFATETRVLDVILPNITPDQYFDDRLADTLDTIFDYGIGNLKVLVTIQSPFIKTKIKVVQQKMKRLNVLNPLQKDILTILEVPMECYSYEHMFDTG